MNNKPELEIFADDVQCGHGATVRRARRGPALLPAWRAACRKAEAEALLVQAFLGEAIETRRATRALREALIGDASTAGSRERQVMRHDGR